MGGCAWCMQSEQAVSQEGKGGFGRVVELAGSEEQGLLVERGAKHRPGVLHAG